MQGGYNGVIACMQAVGPTLASWTTAVTALHPTGLVTIGSNYANIRKCYRVTAIMGVSNLITAQNQFTFSLKMGSVVAWSSGAIACNTAAHTLLPAKLVVDLLLTSTGSGTNAHFTGVGALSGVMWSMAAGADPTTGNNIMCPITAPAEGTGFDSTIANILDFFIGCQTSNAGNSIIVYNYYVEDLN
jgi:hypothetical protein